MRLGRRHSQIVHRGFYATRETSKLLYPSPCQLLARLILRSNTLPRHLLLDWVASAASKTLILPMFIE